MPAISYQLYGSRNFDFDASLKMLAAAGYTEVEGYGALFGQVPDLHKKLTGNGLQMTTGHFGIEDLEADPAGSVALARELGLQAVFAPYLMPEDRPSDAEGWSAFADRLVTAGKPIQDAGIAFGWHNHDFELVDLGDGRTPLDIIAGASRDLKLELDIGWVARAGADPVATIEKFAGQIEVAHIKDIAPVGDCIDEDGWADVGHGVIDWAPIHAALQAAGVNRYVVEHDNPNDDARFATRSLSAVNKF